MYTVAPGYDETVVMTSKGLVPRNGIFVAETLFAITTVSSCPQRIF